jgi:hypothetical protein
LIDSSETGESVEPNALPWDKIQPANYQPVGQFTALLPELEKRHTARVATDPEFRYVTEDIAKYERFFKKVSRAIKFNLGGQLSIGLDSHYRHHKHKNTS